jgi:DNA mismatch repair ATPase MutL
VTDRKFLGARHGTSKISTLEDIEGIKTYGFRGEAIAGLCGLGDVSVTTRVDEEHTARTYELDHHGTIISFSHLNEK